MAMSDQTSEESAKNRVRNHSSLDGAPTRDLRDHGAGGPDHDTIQLKCLEETHRFTVGSPGRNDHLAAALAKRIQKWLGLLIKRTAGVQQRAVEIDCQE